ncbi:hypothetical protein [Phaeodactylibacter xiamenensis]|uniref:hypothetical protein n=1 Tax=Phaeodactylibacter xiamenensis TaxID=1524460 RepID=UPI003BACD57E
MTNKMDYAQWTLEALRAEENKLKRQSLTGNVLIGFLAACRRCADAARASKYCSEQGAKKEHSLSYVTDEQRSAE